MLSLLPRHSGWVPVSLTSPAVSTFPAWVDGSACATSFSRIAQRSLALRPAHSPSHLVTLYTGGFSHFVTSMTAPIASGWSESCRVGLSPTRERCLCTAHTQTGRLVEVHMNDKLTGKNAPKWGLNPYHLRAGCTPWVWNDGAALSLRRRPRKST